MKRTLTRTQTCSVVFLRRGGRLLRVPGQYKVAAFNGADSLARPATYRRQRLQVDGAVRCRRRVNDSLVCRPRRAHWIRLSCRHTDTRLTEQPGYAGTTEAEPFWWILMKQEMIGYVFGRPFVKTVRRMLSVRCMSVCPVCMWRWCIVAKRLDGSRWNLARRWALAPATLC